MTAKEARAISTQANSRIAEKHAVMAKTLFHVFMNVIEKEANRGRFSTIISYNSMIELTRAYSHLFTDGVTMSSFLGFMAEYLKDFGYEAKASRDQNYLVTAITIAW